jgi:hypothetical protein
MKPLFAANQQPLVHVQPSQVKVLSHRASVNQNELSWLNSRLLIGEEIIWTGRPKVLSLELTIPRESLKNSENSLV